MNFLSEPLFLAIFNTSAPRVVVKNDAPNFTIIISNDAQKQINHSISYSGSATNVWEVFGFDSTEDGGGLLLMNAITRAVASREAVLTPAFKNGAYVSNNNNQGNLWQIEVKPIAGTDRKTVEYLLL